MKNTSLNRPTILPTYKGYIVDTRLKEFRLALPGKIDFISFDSDLGDKILTEYIKTLNPDGKEFENIAQAIL